MKRFQLNLILLLLSKWSSLATVTSEVLTANTATTASTTATVSKSYQVFHSFDPSDPNSFTRRGTITLSNSHTSLSPDTETNPNDSIIPILNEDGQIRGTISHEPNCLDPAQLSSFSSDSFYQIKIVEPNTERAVLASVPACDLRRSNYRDTMELTIGPTGSLLSLSYLPSVSPLARPCHALPPLDNDVMEGGGVEFKTVVKYATAIKGMSIPTILPNMKPPAGLKWIPRPRDSTTNPNNPAAGAGNGAGSAMPYDMDSEEERKAREQQSFFRKYWYIIVPLLISTIFTGEEPEQQQQQQQQQGGGQRSSGGGGARPQVAAVPQKQRRGKRSAA